MSSSAVLGNTGVGRSGVVIRAVIHFMDAASKVLKCRWVFEVTSGSLSGSKQRSHTGKNMSRQAYTVYSCSGWPRDVGSSIHQPPLMLPH